MSDLTEQEIFDCLETNVMLAAQDCINISNKPQRGPHYKSFIDRIRLIEGACQQACAWREDTRWLNFVAVVAATHDKAGKWLRGGYAKILFLDLAKLFLDMHGHVQHLRHAKTGRRGMILPDMLPGPHRDTRPSRVMLPMGMDSVRPSGIVVPAGVA